MRNARLAPCPLCPVFSFNQHGDCGLPLAFHVGRSHPELIQTPDELYRRQLEAQLEARRN